MLDLDACVHQFFSPLKGGGIEIYEFSLQHEFGVHLRAQLARTDYRVQFERPVEFFGLSSAHLHKKEIDIAVFAPDHARKVAVELKFPRNGQYPEQMFKACQDVAFLEQLVEAGFDAGLFVMAVDDHLFYEGPDQTGIYAYFRAGKPVNGVISKPTGSKNQAVTIRGTYRLGWQDAVGVRYSFLTVDRSPMSNRRLEPTTPTDGERRG